MLSLTGQLVHPRLQAEALQDVEEVFLALLNSPDLCRSVTLGFQDHARFPACILGTGAVFQMLVLDAFLTIYCVLIIELLFRVISGRGRTLSNVWIN